MPQIVQQGSLNTTALIVPDLYVQIVPPQNLLINGVPTNVLGMVGTAQWGPVGQAMIVGSMAQYASIFGSLQNRKYDMGTATAIAAQQGASNFRCIRVSDGTDAAASVVVPTAAITLTALYTGTLGNSLTVTISAGSKAATWRAVVGIAGYQPEVFNNVPGTANAFWVNLAAAINTGNDAQRGPSNYVSAIAGAGTTAPSAATYTLSGGTDGVATITAAVLVGVDTTPRKGMYALRGQGTSVAMLADADDSTQWTTQAAFGLSEGIYMIVTAPAGTAIANGTTGTVDLKATAGLDSYAVKLLHGDWIYWNDPVNLVTRLVSPQGFAAGRLANLSPEHSSLNKQIYGVVGSQKAGLSAAQNTTYATAELQVLIQNGIDVICNPQPGGNYWGLRAGHNSSSNASTSGDNYTRMTNYIASTIAAGMGVYVGALINAGLFAKIRGTLLNFFSNLVYTGQLALNNGVLPFGVICDYTNNPPSMTGLGYVTANVQVQYQAINERFIVNLEGGQTVSVLRQATGASQPATPSL
jgi:hypothetical protein